MFGGLVTPPCRNRTPVRVSLASSCRRRNRTLVCMPLYETERLFATMPPRPVFQGFLTRTCVSLRETIVCRIDRAAFLCILTAFLPLFWLFAPLAVRAVRHIAQCRTHVCCFQSSGRSGSVAPLCRAAICSAVSCTCVTCSTVTDDASL